MIYVLKLSQISVQRQKTIPDDFEMLTSISNAQTNENKGLSLSPAKCVEFCTLLKTQGRNGEAYTPQWEAVNGTFSKPVITEGLKSHIQYCIEEDSFESHCKKPSEDQILNAQIKAKTKISIGL